MKVDIKNEKAEFACRVCQERAKRDYPNAIGCAFREIDGEYCEELEKIINKDVERPNFVLAGVEEYCEGCEDFNPEVSRLYDGCRVIKTTIYCTHASFCKRTRERLKARAVEGMKSEDEKP